MNEITIEEVVGHLPRVRKLIERSGAIYREGIENKADDNDLIRSAALALNDFHLMLGKPLIEPHYAVLIALSLLELTKAQAREIELVESLAGLVRSHDKYSEDSEAFDDMARLAYEQDIEEARALCKRAGVDL